MMNYTKEKTDAYKKYAEVFTPAGTVFEMILYEGVRDCVRDVDATILDPAVGQGQFPCAELVCKMFYNIDRLTPELALRAVQSLYVIDIQTNNVKTTQNHLLATLLDSYEFFTGKLLPVDIQFAAHDAVNNNFIVGDSLKIMEEWTKPQQSLFDEVFYHE